MLTSTQEKYLASIPETEIAKVNLWDPTAAEFAKDLIRQLRDALPNTEVFWSGALALGISGLNDIDLSILAKLEDFGTDIPKIVSILGEPKVKGVEKVLWRTIKNGYRVDAYLGSKDSEDIKLHKKIFQILSADPNLLKEYELLKADANGTPFREYQKRKFEFYNRILTPTETPQEK